MTLPAFLLLLPVTGVALMLIAGRQTHASFAPLVACGLLTTLLYLAGVAGLLAAGAWLLFWGGTLAALPAIWMLWRAGALRTALLNPTLCALAALTVLHGLLFSGAEYFKWDEFSHWGLAVREMLGTDSLYGPGGNVYFLNYPPGMPLWHYFGAMNTTYSEGSTYTFQFVILLAATLPLLHRLSWREWPQIVAVLATALFLLNVLGHGWVSLYVDHVVAAVFLGVMLLLVAGERDEGSPRAEARAIARAEVPDLRMLWAMPCLILLVLTKDVGLYFAICAGIFWALRSLVFDRRRMQFALAAALIVVPMLTNLSWSWYVEATGVAQEERVLAVGDAIDKVLAGGGEGREDIPGRFATVFLSQETGSSDMMIKYNEFSWALMPEYGDNLRPSAFAWMLISAVIMAIAWWLQPAARRQITLVSAFMLGTTVIYFVMVFALYQFVFPEAAANTIRSYIRYANIGLMPLVGIAFALLLPGFGRPEARWAPLALLLAPLLYLISPPALSTFYEKPWTQPLRSQMAPLINYMQANTAHNDAVYVYVPRDQQFVRMLAVHDLTPTRARVDSRDYAAGDTNMLEQQIAGNAFAWFTVFNPELTRALAPLIPAEHRKGPVGGLFAVREDGDSVRLIPVTPK